MQSGSALVRGSLRAVALASLLACAAGPHLAPATSAAPLTRRVRDVLTRHHISPLSDAELPGRFFAELTKALGCTHAPPSNSERAHVLAALAAGDLSFVARVAAGCGAALPSEERQLAFVLHALTQAHDPHSRYLDAPALARFHDHSRAIHEDAPTLRAELVEYAGHRIAVLSLPSIYLRRARSASADLRRALAELRAQGAEVVLLDLRGNGGGVIKESARMFAAFAGSAPMAIMRRRDRAPELLEAPAEAVAWQGPMLVRVDAGTASVAEVLAAALQDSGRALLIGQPTYGKGTGQSLVHLGSPLDSSEGAVDVTDRRFYRRDGRALQCAGVTPDILLPGGPSTTECARKEALQPDKLSTAPEPSAPAPYTTRPDAAPVRAALAYCNPERVLQAP